MLTLHIEANNLQELRARALAELALDMAMVAEANSAPAEKPKGRKKADTPSSIQAPQEQSAQAEAPAASAPNAAADTGAKADMAPEAGKPLEPEQSKTAAAAAPAVDPNVPDITKVREAVFEYMKKQGEKVGAAPKTIALIQKYDAKLVTDIKPERRAEFIKECLA